MKLQKKHWVMIIVGILALVAAWYFFLRNKNGAAGSKESSYNGGLPFPGESSFNPFRPFNPVMDIPGTQYTIAKNGFGFAKSGNQRVIKGQTATKAGECAAQFHDGQWLIPVNYSSANTRVHVPAELLQNK